MLAYAKVKIKFWLTIVGNYVTSCFYIDIIMSTWLSLCQSFCIISFFFSVAIKYSPEYRRTLTWALRFVHFCNFLCCWNWYWLISFSFQGVFISLQAPFAPIPFSTTQIDILNVSFHCITHAFFHYLFSPEIFLFFPHGSPDLNDVSASLLVNRM